MARSATIERTTKETAIKLTLNLDGSGRSQVSTGVGFFDRIHGQTGVAPNGIELHPVVSFSARGCAPR